MSEEWYQLRVRAAGCDDEFAVKEPGVVGGYISHVVEARDPASEHLLRRNGIGVRDAGSQVVLKAAEHLPEMTEFKDLGECPNRESIVVAFPKMGHECFVRTGLPELDPGEQ